MVINFLQSSSHWTIASEELNILRIFKYLRFQLYEYKRGPLQNNLLQTLNYRRRSWSVKLQYLAKKSNCLERYFLLQDFCSFCSKVDFRTGHTFIQWLAVERGRVGFVNKLNCKLLYFRFGLAHRWVITRQPAKQKRYTAIHRCNLTN